jgi:hypothetical protein
MRTVFYRVVGPPPGEGAPTIEQLRWVRRIVVRCSTPLAVFAAVVLVVIGHVSVAAPVVAALQLWSIASINARIRREERKLHRT